jgi:peptidoglycan/xylan/chitin deacetylase (PgdA/CDA1 family)
MLTFDACSTQGPSQFDERVLRTLIDMQVPATLFLGGKWMEEHPDETMELARYPQFELANHTYLHPHLPRESDERVYEELTRTQDMLYTLTGRRATLFRAPYGELDARVVQIGAQSGMIAIQYDLASGDPDPHVSSKRLIEYVTDKAKNGSIVVLHMNGRGWKTADALPRIVLRLRKKGYKLVTVSELIGRPAAPAVNPAPVLRD